MFLYGLIHHICMLGIICPYCLKAFEHFGTELSLFCPECGKKLRIEINVYGDDPEIPSISASEMDVIPQFSNQASVPEAPAPAVKEAERTPKTPVAAAAPKIAPELAAAPVHPSIQKTARTPSMGKYHCVTISLPERPIKRPGAFIGYKVRLDGEELNCKKAGAVEVVTVQNGIHTIEITQLNRVMLETKNLCQTFSVDVDRNAQIVFESSKDRFCMV